jgi:hypothetical protein
MASAAKFRFPDSGQTRCYDRDGREIPRPRPGDDLYGQDGCFVTNPLSYTKLGIRGRVLSQSAHWQDGLRMVMDNNTGLTWEIKSPTPGQLNFAGDRYTWEDAQKVYVKKLNARKYGGFADWRVPNKDELRSIVDYGATNPAIDTLYFPDCKVDNYWCADTYRMQDCFGWVIFFGLGSGTAAAKTSLQHVRAVRGGRNKLFGKPDAKRFVDNGDGTVTDSVAGLMWQKGENPRCNWFEALKACTSMTLAGHSNWRLPNIKELNTILNLGFDDGWWYFRKLFPAEGLQPPLLHYFSSSVHEDTYAWVTNFCFGYDGYYASKMATLLFRAVRTIEPARLLDERFRLPDTGQRTLYDDEGKEFKALRKGQAFYGQDGCYLINPMSFVKLRENGRELPDDAEWDGGLRMVLDRNTGLVWEVKSPVPGDTNFVDDRYTWQEASDAFITQMNKRCYGGFSDWRLPSREELRSIVDYGGGAPAVSRVFFGDCQPTFHWSKDAYGSDPRLMWGIYFAYGCAICYSRDKRYHVRAVRGGHNPSFGDASRYAFTDNNDGTVSDLNTGLMWVKGECPELTVRNALKYCEELEYAGHRDWRLPNMKEIGTLIDIGFTGGAWHHKQFFPDVKTKPQGFYSASSTFGATFVWGVNFQFGYDGYYGAKKSGKYPFRPVRTIG